MIRFIAAFSVLVATLLPVGPAAAQDARQESGDGRRIERREDRREARRLRRLERREWLARMRERLGRDGVHLRVFRSYTLPEDATATEPVVILGASARIDGHAEDDVVVIGGALRLGPTAVVDGNVMTVGGTLTREPGAAVGGTISEAALPWPAVTINPGWNMSEWWPALAVGGAVFRLSFVLMIAVLVTLVAPGWIAAIAGRPAATSGLLGLATEVLLVPALLVVSAALVISIVGIPLLSVIPFLLAAFGVIWVAGFTGIAVRLGAALRGSRAGEHASVSDLLIGYMAIVGVTMTGQVLAVGLGWLSPMVWPIRVTGLAIEYVAWTVGLGAAVASLVSSRRAMPPQLPTQSGL